jgi:hypothetical protein
MVRADRAVPAAAELQMSFNLATILRESAKSRPDQALTYFADRNFRYAEVDETSGRGASSLLRLGGWFRTGDLGYRDAAAGGVQVPPAVHILDELPCNAAGKVLTMEPRVR